MFRTLKNKNIQKNRRGLFGYLTLNILSSGSRNVISL